MKLLIVSATPFEILPISQMLEKDFEQIADNQYQSGELIVTILITGVGSVATVFSLTKQLTNQKYDLVLNAGIAGALNLQLSIGTVVNVITEQFGDIGVEEANGHFTTLFELELVHPNQVPFSNKLLYNKLVGDFQFLPTANGITVNTVHGHADSIELFKKKFDADVESMEGAAVFYVCLLEDQPFLQLRSISNFVEERNRENWDIELAIANLNKVIAEIIGIFNKN